MKYVVDKTKRPVYLELYERIKADIVGGVYSHGEKLPSKRGLAEEVGVSTVTVEHAYALLIDEGYAEARERSGYVVIFRGEDGFLSSSGVARIRREGARTESDYPTFPVSVFAKTVRRVLSDGGELLHARSENLGTLELREAIRRYLARNRGIRVGIEQIVIGAGAEYLYRLIIELLGREKLFAIESPSYNKIAEVYRAAGVRYESLPLTETGLDAVALSTSSADVLHTTPYRSYPSGVTASATKRHEYLRWASERERYVIEDDFESEFSVFVKPAETLFALSKGANVIYLNTFSKTISPSLRIGYMVLPKHLSEVFSVRLGFYSCTVPSFMQLVLAELIDNGDFERHINRVRRKKRREI